MKWKITPEASLPDAYHQAITPFWNECVVQDRFIGQHAVPIHYAYCLPDNPSATVVISSGRIESLLKYKEVIFDLYQNNLAVFILDHRGQGLSGRMTQDPHQGYVQDFGDYVADFAQFFEQIVTPKATQPCTLLCHSMGSAIGALTLLNHPTWFERAIFCSPMFGIKPAFPNWLSTILIGAGMSVNKLKREPQGYFPGQRGYHAYPFPVNTLTHSKVRYQLFRDLYETQPELQLGGVTTAWLRAALIAMNTIENNTSKLTLPVLAFSAKMDLVVDNRRQQRVINSMPNARLVKVSGAKHELLIEKDPIRHEVMQHILDFVFSSVH